MIPPPPRSTLFPSRRSSDLTLLHTIGVEDTPSLVFNATGIVLTEVDRKSTRLNSSHVAISYAVFCLKKKILGLTILKDAFSFLDVVFVTGQMSFDEYVVRVL